MEEYNGKLLKVFMRQCIFKKPEIYILKHYLKFLKDTVFDMLACVQGNIFSRSKWKQTNGSEKEKKKKKVSIYTSTERK